MEETKIYHACSTKTPTERRSTQTNHDWTDWNISENVHGVDIWPLTKKKIGEDWTEKEEKIQGFLRAINLEALEKILTAEYRIDPEKEKVAELLKIYNRYYLSKRNNYNCRWHFFWAKSKEKYLEGHWEKIIELEIEYSSHIPTTNFYQNS